MKFVETEGTKGEARLSFFSIPFHFFPIARGIMVKSEQNKTTQNDHCKRNGETQLEYQCNVLP